VYFVTYTPISRQRLGKHIVAEANARNDKTSIVRQRISKHAYLAEAFSAWSVQNGYKEKFRGWQEQYRVEFLFASLQGHELGSYRII
jgi:hypothetical protein